MKFIGALAAVALAILVAAGLATAETPSSEDSPQQPGFSKQDKYIVVLEDSVEHPGAVAEAQADRRDADLGFVYRNVISGYSADELSRGDVEALRSNPSVAYVEPDPRGGVTSQQTPTGVKRIFGLDNPAIDIDEEDDLRVNVDVAVFDSGIDDEHPDLNVVSQVICGMEACAAGGDDALGHGTHVAGTIGALDNDYGVVGVAPGARLWSVRVLNSKGEGYLSQLIAGMDWVTARADQIEVTNASIRYWGDEYNKAFDEALRATQEAGIVSVAAAGNESEEVRYLPGSDPDEITVSALHDADGTPSEGFDSLANYSNFGPLVDIAAPGSWILSTLPAGEYGIYSGTSMASPHVAGAAALLASAWPTDSIRDVEAIRDTLVEEGNYDWLDYEWDAHEPLLDISAPVFWASTATSDPAIDVSDSEATLSATVMGKGLPTTYWFEYGKTPSYGAKTSFSLESLESPTGAVEISETIDGLEAGSTYHFRVAVESEGFIAYGEDETFVATAPPVWHLDGEELENEILDQLNFSGELTFESNGLSTTCQVALGGLLISNDETASPPAIGEAFERYINGCSVDQEGCTVSSEAFAGNSWDASFFGGDGFAFEDVGFQAKYGSGCPVEGLRSWLGTLNGKWDDSEDCVTYDDSPYGNSGEVLVRGKLCFLQNEGKRVRTFSTAAAAPAFALSFGAEGSGNGQVRTPYGVATDSSGNAWVADYENYRVQKFNSKGEYLSKFGSEGSGNGQFNEPLGIAVDSSGNVWVTDGANNRVQKFNSKGEYLSKFGSEGSGNGQFVTPTDVEADSAGNVYIVDAGNNRVQKFNSKGEFLSQFGSAGSGNGQFNEPFGLAIDPMGNLYVTDSANNRIQKFNSKGEYLSQFGSAGSGDGQFEYGPLSVAVDPWGYVWVPDIADGRVQKFNASGEYLTSFGSKGSGDGQFFELFGIAADPQGGIWTTDSYNTHMLQKWEFELPPAYEAPPVVSTSAPTKLSPSEATLNASVNPQGKATSYQFEYGETTSYGTKVPISAKSVGEGNATVKVSEAIKGLEVEHDYHYRIVASNSVGTSYGVDKTFHIEGPPKASTGAATAVGSTHARLHGTVDPEGHASTYRFFYSEEGSNVSWTTPEKEVPAGAKNVQVSASIKGLTPDLTYGYRLVVSNAYGTATSEEETFTTGEAIWHLDGEELNEYEEAHLGGELRFYFTSGGFINCSIESSEVVIWNEEGARAQVVGGEIEEGRCVTNLSGCSGSNALPYGFSWNANFSSRNILEIKKAYFTDTFVGGVYCSSLAGKKSWTGDLVGEWDDSTGCVSYKDGVSIVTYQPGWTGKVSGELCFSGAEGKELRIDGPLTVGDPKATTKAATKVSATESTLNASVNPGGEAATYQFEYGETTAYGSKAPASPKSAGSGSADVEVSETAEGLKPSTTYHFRAVAYQSAGGTDFGADMTFTTPAVPSFKFSFGSLGSGNGQMQYPFGVAVDSTGNVWVVDSQNSRVQKFNSKGEYLSQFGSAGFGNGQFSEPLGVAVDSSDNVWVADSQSQRLQKFNSKGEYLSKFGSEGSGNGQFLWPAGVAIDAEGNLWVLDGVLDRVQKFNSKGEYLSKFGSEGTGNGQFLEPLGIAVDSSGNVWVADGANNRVQKFNSKGEYLSKFGSEGTGNGQFSGPYGIAADSSGNVWVADVANNRVQKFNSNGKYQLQFGTNGSGSGQFNTPFGIAVDLAGGIWVADSENNRVQKWAP